MNRDPYYYLKKADQIRANTKKYDSRLLTPYLSNPYLSNPYLSNTTIINIDDIDDIDDNDDNYNNGDDNELDNDIYYKEINNIQTYKPTLKRYYDPVTRHYFKINNDTDDNIIIDDNVIIDDNLITDDNVWYPIHQPINNLVRDKTSGKLYRITKIYDANGDYYYNYKPINHFAIKKPGTNYYQPSYSTGQNVVQYC